jgi:hypothetical protein
VQLLLVAVPRCSKLTPRLLLQLVGTPRCHTLSPLLLLQLVAIPCGDKLSPLMLLELAPCFVIHLTTKRRLVYLASRGDLLQLACIN